MDQCNGTESPEVNPHNYGHLIFDEECNNIQWGKYGLIRYWYWESWTSTCKSMKLEHPHTIHKNKLKITQRLKYKRRYCKASRRDHW